MHAPSSPKRIGPRALIKSFSSPPLVRYLDLRLWGRVQGVGLRMLVWAEARRRDLGGWTANEEDGTVRVRAEGEEKALDEFKHWLSSLHDPFGADVRSLKIEASGGLAGAPKKPFSISLPDS